MKIFTTAFGILIAGGLLATAQAGPLSTASVKSSYICLHNNVDFTSVRAYDDTDAQNRCEYRHSLTSTDPADHPAPTAFIPPSGDDSSPVFTPVAKTDNEPLFVIEQSDLLVTSDSNYRIVVDVPHCAVHGEAANNN